MGAAWIAAFSALGVALIGVIGNNINIRRKQPEVEHEAADLEQDLNIMRALASALEQETKRRVNAERRLAACEAREQVREP